MSSMVYRVGAKEYYITFTYAISISRDGFTVPVVGVSDLQMENPGSPGTTETVGGNV